MQISSTESIHEASCFCPVKIHRKEPMFQDVERRRNGQNAAPQNTMRAYTELTDYDAHSHTHSYRHTLLRL